MGSIYTFQSKTTQQTAMFAQKYVRKVNKYKFHQAPEVDPAINIFKTIQRTELVLPQTSDCKFNYNTKNITRKTILLFKFARYSKVKAINTIGTMPLSRKDTRLPDNYDNNPYRTCNNNKVHPECSASHNDDKRMNQILENRATT